MKRITLEVCVESVADAVAAERGGADRLELCSALELDGLTPSVGLFCEVRAAVRLPVLVMIRPRAGTFVYTESEVRVMRRDIELFAAHSPHGFVFGPLNASGGIDLETTHSLRQACGSSEVVFHRAFDHTADPLTALDQLAELRFTRVLTSGRHETAEQGAKGIALLVRHAGGRIGVLPCGRVRAANAVRVVQYTGCDGLHGSFRVSGATSAEAVAAARAAVDQWAGFGDSDCGV